MITKNLFLAHNLRICDLINHETRQWRDDMLEYFFIRRDQEEIRRVPLSPEVSPDILVWHYEKSGTFSVRSAYHMGMNFMGRSQERGGRGGFLAPL